MWFPFGSNALARVYAPQGERGAGRRDAAPDLFAVVPAAGSPWPDLRGLTQLGDSLHPMADPIPSSHPSSVFS